MTKPKVSSKTSSHPMPASKPSLNRPSRYNCPSLPETMTTLHAQFKSRIAPATLALALTAGISQVPSHAATLDSATAEFQAVVTGATCSFGATTPGQLAISEDSKTISTENSIAAGGTRTSYTFTTNFSGAQIVVDNLLATINGTALTPAASTLFLSRNGSASEESSTSGSVTLNNNIPVGGDTLQIGLSYTSGDDPFEPGTHDASVTVTCTDNGSK